MKFFSVTPADYPWPMLNKIQKKGKSNADAWLEVSYALWRCQEFYDDRTVEYDDVDEFLEEIIGTLKRAFS
jgi:hypothetical protein